MIIESWIRNWKVFDNCSKGDNKISNWSNLILGNLLVEVVLIYYSNILVWGCKFLILIFFVYHSQILPLLDFVVKEYLPYLIVIYITFIGTNNIIVWCQEICTSWSSCYWMVARPATFSRNIALALTGIEEVVIDDGHHQHFRFLILLDIL